jgi:hypothetical protein
MKREKTMCDFEMLSRLSDQELAGDDAIWLDQHLRECPACQKGLRHHEAISSFFGNRLIHDQGYVESRDIERNVIAVIERKKLPWLAKARHCLLSQRFYVPAGVVATALLMFFALVGPKNSVPGYPTATVSYLGGDIESVMILETKKSRQTILWFNETLTSNGEEGPVEDGARSIRTRSTRSYFMS